MMTQSNYNTLPLKNSIDMYVDHGIPVGGFLEAVITNNLKEAVARADAVNIHRLNVYVMYLYNECPMNCWGSLWAYRGWLEMHANARAIAARAAEALESEEAARVDRRIRFMRNIPDVECDALLATAGELGTVTAVNGEGTWVINDEWPKPFKAQLGVDFEWLGS